MVSIPSLWLPILLSSVLVFFVSFLLHMVIPHHRADFKKLPREDEVMAALRGFGIPPGDYMMPRVEIPAQMKDPAFIEKRAKGPVAVFTIMPSGSMSMGTNLGQWFVHSLVVGVICAYVAGRALGPGTSYLQVFRFVGVTAYLAYSFALIQLSIWYRRSWGTTIRYQIDGLLLGMVTAGTFGWLWPR
jgi:hypothetical protein